MYSDDAEKVVFCDENQCKTAKIAHYQWLLELQLQDVHLVSVNDDNVFFGECSMSALMAE